MNRPTIASFSAVALLAGLASTAWGSIATTNYVEVVPVDNRSLLPGYLSYDLMMTTPASDWTTGAILLNLSSGTIYQADLGTDTPVPSDLFNLLPELEFDTYVGVPGGHIAGGAGDLGGDQLTLTSTKLDVSFYNVAKDNIGTFSIGRITLSEDAIGTWSLASNTGDDQRVDLVGTISNGLFSVDADASAAAALAAYMQTAEYEREHRRQGEYVPKDFDITTLFVPIPEPPVEVTDDETSSTLPEPGMGALVGLGILAAFRRRRNG